MSGDFPSGHARWHTNRKIKTFPLISFRYPRIILKNTESHLSRYIKYVNFQKAKNTDSHFGCVFIYDGCDGRDTVYKYFTFSIF